LSINNIILSRTDNESEATGLLIDYDLSVETKVTRGCAPNASDMRAAAEDTGHVAAGRVQAVSEPEVQNRRMSQAVCFFT